MNYQAGFARRWGHLHQPHVRALAWLLDSPDLLDAGDPAWAGKLATPSVLGAAGAAWLAQLDADPAPLLAALGERPYTRLGLYAEKLMAFYYQAEGRLVAHGLQVRASRNDTVGEFDFLLRLTGDDGADHTARTARTDRADREDRADATDGADDADGGRRPAAQGIEHIELATKFYLLEGAAASRFDTLIGPNLADSLGAKMRKIVGKQLALAAHPAAQAVLPAPVLRARALVKGWLFYPLQTGATTATTAMAGIASGHCSGFWCTSAALAGLPPAHWVILPRLQWLAPYRLGADRDAPPAGGQQTDRLPGAGDVLDAAALAQAIDALFAHSPAPVMVASLRALADGSLVEDMRGFVVPPDWQARAALRRRA